MSDEKAAKFGDDHQHFHQDHQQQQQQQYYGTFGGGPTGYPTPQQYQQPAMGFPQPVPPPGLSGAPVYPPTHFAHGYQAVQGYQGVSEGRPVRHPRLPCCGMGMGWFLFITGFFFVAIPWYVAAFILLCARVDYREKPGYVACTIAAIIATIAILFGATKGADIDIW